MTVLGNLSRVLLNYDVLVMTTLKIQRIRNSLGVVFSKDILQKLKVQEGDTVLVTETPYGICLTSCDSDLDKVMKAYK